MARDGAPQLRAHHERMKNDPGYAAEIGRKGGKNKKGKKHLTTIIKDIGNDMDWSKAGLNNTPELEEKYGNNAWEALVYIAFRDAFAGDGKVRNQARTWLAKNGFGEKLDITSDGERITVPPMIISEIKPRGIVSVPTESSQE